LYKKYADMSITSANTFPDKWEKHSMKKEPKNASPAFSALLVNLPFPLYATAK